MAYPQDNYGFDATHDESLSRRLRSPPPNYADNPLAPSHSHSSNHSLPTAARSHPAAHPDSAYSRLRSQRSGPSQASSPVSASSGPPPPPHSQRRAPAAQDPGYSQSGRSTVTPGRDNLGAIAAGGGIAGIAVGVAHSNERQSGLDAMRGRHDDGMGQHQYYGGPPERGANAYGSDNPYIPAPEMTAMGPSRTLGGPDSNSSHLALGSAMDGPGQLTPGQRSLHFTSSEGSGGNNTYQQPSQYGGAGGFYDDPYPRHPRNSWGPNNPETINPNDIVDDGDDGFIPNPQRRSVLSLGRNSSHNSLPVAGAAGAAGGAAGGAAAGGILGNISGRADGGPAYNAVPVEKSEWLNNQKSGNKKLKWTVGIIIALILVGAIVGGAVGGILGSRRGDSGGGGGQSAGDDEKENGDLGINSREIKELMDNPNLYKVFPGMDYTAWGTQYPLCHKYPPSQNNVTRDMAVLSKLTNVVRLYGTDCNQTEMVLHAIKRLELKDMKLWLGVWIDNNATTNDRQIEQLYKIVDKAEDNSIFKGVIVGNEVLFRGKDGASPLRTISSLSKYMKDVKSQLKKMNVDIPVATSDLGDDWTAELAQVADAVMSNVHPFFAGVPVDQAAGWTWNFWQDHNVQLTKGTKKPQVISEVGWPSGGGNNCAPAPKCPDKKSGAVAGVDEMNKFMNDWVCQSLANGTDYFWFEAFDEPWKEAYNEPELGKEWEDKWGLMDPGRKLKPGLKIPDCGGKTVG
ncbi:hypothetical protein FQN55_001264 [Onygenales sp. PD_40]|nr:hypothetical protein FQN55_001264 [Onygenales sp. PD_40]